MHELVLGVGQPSHGKDRELAELRVERGAVAQMAAERDEPLEQVRRVSERTKDVADRLAALFGDPIEGFAILFGKVFAVQIRYSRHF